MTAALSNVSKLGAWVCPESYGAVGDGATDDGPALALAVATGRDISLLPGRSYLMNSRTLTALAGQRFYGGGELKKTAIAGSGEQFISVSGVDDVVIEGITFNDARVSGSRSYGVTVINAARTRILGNTFLGMVTPVFVWRLSSYTQVVGNVMTGTDGTFGVATGGDSSGNTNGLVTDTLIAYNVIGNKVSEAIDVNWDTHRCYIVGNVCFDNNTVDGDDDIDVGGGDCRDIWLIGNTVDSPLALFGIHVKRECSEIHIWNNTIRNGLSSSADSRAIYIDSRDGYTVQKCSVIGNTVSGYARGIAVSGEAASTGCKDVLVQGNTITVAGTEATSRGIDIQAGANERIKVLDNIIDGADVSIAAGIYVTDVTVYEVRGNTIRRFGDDGIQILADASGGDVSHNHITDCDHGIVCIGPNTSLHGNHCYLNDRNGIRIEAAHVSATGNHVYDNAVVTDDSYGIVADANATYALITGNKVYDTRGGSARMNGVSFSGAADRVLFTSNIVYPVKTTAVNGSGSLTNSTTTGNITS